jgi:hypothetical protein
MRLILSCALWFAASAIAAEVGTVSETQWIEDAGGAVIRDAGGRITGVDLRASWVTDSDLRKLKRLPDLTYLDLSRNSGICRQLSS